MDIICYHGETRFVELVRMAANASRPQNVDTWFSEGRRMAYLDLNYLPSNFCEFGLNAAWKEGHVVGFPTGGFLTTDGLLVVSKDCRHLKEVSEFLVLFLTDEKQIRHMEGIEVIKYPLEKIVPDEEGRYWFYAYGMKEKKELHVFEDGTTPVHRAEAFLENCVAMPVVDKVVDQILYDEFDAPRKQGCFLLCFFS